MAIESLIVIGTVFMLGWVLGQAYMAYRLRQSIQQIAEKYGMTMKEWEDTFSEISNIKVNKIENLFTETIGNSIMLYNKDTGTFLCQAENIENLAKNAYEHSNVKFAMVTHEEKDMFFVEGKVSSSLE